MFNHFKPYFINFNILVLFAGIILFASCDENYYPKPIGYFRIQLPQKKYRILDSIYPYTFEYPVYAKISPDSSNLKETNWINIDFPQFNGTLHISYKPVHKNLSQYLDDSRMFVNKHIPKANDIENKVFINESAKVFGSTYEIKGNAAASPFQFFVTDSTHHFVRGALYFNVLPNNDSLAPVIDFIQKDIIHLINTFKWKEK